MTKLYVPWAESYPAWNGIKQSLIRIGVDFTDKANDSGITHVMPLSDGSAAECIRVAEERGVPYMGRDTMLAISDKALMAQLFEKYRVSTLKTIVPMSPDDLAAFPDGRVLAKKRRTYNKMNLFPFAYQVFPSKEALMEQFTDEFWAYQKNPDSVTGEYVVQEAADNDGQFDEMRIIPFVINGKSQVLRVRNTHVRYRVGDASFVQDVFGCSNFDDIEDQMQAIERAVAGLGIRNAFMAVQFIKKGGQWYLIDWNFRTGVFVFMVTAYARPQLFDSYMSHMLDVAYTPIVPTDVFYFRRFESEPTDEVRTWIAHFGLDMIRSDQRLPPGMKEPLLVYGFSENKDELMQRFAALEGVIA